VFLFADFVVLTRTPRFRVATSFLAGALLGATKGEGGFLGYRVASQSGINVGNSRWSEGIWVLNQARTRLVVIAKDQSGLLAFDLGLPALWARRYLRGVGVGALRGAKTMEW
jgi:hypothetical protein